MMDTLWFLILDGLRHVKGALDLVFSPLHVLGPCVSIGVIAVLTAAAAKLLTKKIKTRRYRELEKEFYYWFNIKQEALKLKDADPENAKALGKTIDKATLNKAYYDYFFEGLLNNLLTMYIPIVSMLGYVNATYRPEALEAMFGRPYLFILHWVNGRQYEIGAVFWFVFCVFMFYVISFFAGVLYKRFAGGQTEKTGGSHTGTAEAETANGAGKDLKSVPEIESLT
ncbi:MAG: hypothetical protein KGY56_13260 [Desulfobacterales bacterium]|nr:hypothetical protein [Desulfobacterales bacterium]